MRSATSTPTTLDSGLPAATGLYHPSNEHDACGVGFVANIKGQKSHEIIKHGLLILKNLDHRGAVGADPLQGDGAGILIQIPDALYRHDMAAKGITLPPTGEYGVGMAFLPREEAARLACEQEIERSVRAEGQQVIGWRDVPIDSDMPMSERVRSREPVIRQIFVGRGADIWVTDALERKLYIIRRRAANAIKALQLEHGSQFYQPSFSARTVVYKGLLLADQVGVYYRDLVNPLTVSGLALVHQRFSTNTFPTWGLAHPFRMIAHNGEINTMRGNVNWFKAREKSISSTILGQDLCKIWPLHYPNQSDSACFDNALELLVMGGYSLAQAMMLMIPEAWEKHKLMDKNRRAFYEYYAAMMEPWDGPAAVAFTDGRQIGATLDRNGLRPARYLVTHDDLVVMASESGVLPIPEANIKQKWRLQPGKMFLIDLEQGRIINDKELKDNIANAKPYREWIEAIGIKLDDLPRPDYVGEPHSESLLDLQQAFGFTEEDIKFILRPMAMQGEEATGSMGNDAALTVLSQRAKQFYHYFRQLFAQVTNPPIDPIREDLVMSLISFVGPKPNLLNITEINPPIRLEVAQPILSFSDIEKIRHISVYTQNKIRSQTLDICYPVTWGAQGIEAKLASLAAEAEDALALGANIIILSDRNLSRDTVAIPALLATSTVHHHLVKKGLRTNTGLVVETGSAKEVHHFALLGGYGAEAVHPYIALETLAAMAQGDSDKAAKYTQNFIKAVGKGLMKVMSKMGISTYMSYTGAEIFEAIGLQSAFVDKYFPGTRSLIEGIGIFQVAEEMLIQHRSAFSDDPMLSNRLDVGGDYAYRAQGEQHLWTPDAIAKLQHATRSNNPESYRQYAQLINDQSERQLTLRGLFKFNPTQAAIPIEEVEPAVNIVKRFATGAMSLGSISTEAHTTLAVAMNRLGARSNTGEGGEDARRFPAVLKETQLSEIIGSSRISRDLTLKAGDSLRSSIKQVASGRFGVTAEYLLNADQIQIKMAQGAKPGEGGQLPGHKVSEYIGYLRHSVPGVGLISPPPHHDIYSIEDLAQLIHDLKNANTAASISVKLVSEVGVGTVAAGVAKAKADHVVIAGHDGGTGASPISSVKHAGSPWELGLAETQQTLVMNRLRGRIRVQVDGQLKTGRDVVIGALLGADEFGFATAPLVVQGCIMMRKCHLNTCPVGIATQDPVLRQRFSGQPEHVVNYFFFVAEEVREIMAMLGVRTFDELIGQTKWLDGQHAIAHWKAHGLNFDKIFAQPNVPGDVARRHVDVQQHNLEHALDHQLIKLSEAALNNGDKCQFSVMIRNRNRTAGTMLSSEVTRRYGAQGLPEDTIEIDLLGTAGQSFGAFLAPGITMRLTGECNDYVGKGLSGGRIIVKPSKDFDAVRSENIIVGNTVLYGATAGEAYFSGVAGERFAVRNSGALAVVEGVGDHGCEYMTGGTVAVLGQVGRNFAAGMSGGIAYIYDPLGNFKDYCNLSMVDIEQLKPSSQQQDCLHLGKTDEELLKSILIAHAELTDSPRAKEILADWDQKMTAFVKVLPHEYRRVLMDQQQNAA